MTSVTVLRVNQKVVEKKCHKQKKLKRGRDKSKSKRKVVVIGTSRKNYQSINTT